MTTPPLPPITKHSEPMLKNWPWTEVELAWVAARDAQWQAYATAARADLEAENKRLRGLLEIPPEESDRVMTVVYRNPTRDEVRSFMDHPKAVWFGWCHAPYQRDAARAALESQP